MNDTQNMPVEPHDDGKVQEDPLYQEPSEGIVTHVGNGEPQADETNSHGDRSDNDP